MISRIWLHIIYFMTRNLGDLANTAWFFAWFIVTQPFYKDMTVEKKMN